MKRSLIIIAVILATGSSVTVWAQMSDRVEVKEATDRYHLGLTKPPSLPFFDLSRLNLSHSYSIGYFSGSGFSGTQAYYNGTIHYQLANPLTLTLNIGVLHDPGAVFGGKNFNDNSMFLPSGWLDWRPSENFRMSIGFETVPAYYRGGDYYNPGRFRYWPNR